MRHRLCGRLLSALFAVLVVASVTEPSAGAADPVKNDTSLKLVPADAAFYSTSLRHKEQLDLFLNSKAFAKLKDLPAVKMGLEKFQQEWKNPKGDLAPLRKFYEDPGNKELVDFFGDALSHECFVYGGDSWVGFMQLYQAVNNAQAYEPLIELIHGEQPDPKAQLYHVLKALDAHPKLLRVPDLVIGYKVTDAKRAAAQIDKLQKLAAMAEMMQPELKGRVKREKVAGGDFLTLNLTGADFKIDDADFGEVERQKGEFNGLKKRIKEMKVTVALGVKDGYLMLAIGSGTEGLAKLGGSGKALTDLKELAPLKKFSDKPLTSVSYVSKDFLVAAMGDFSGLEKLADAAADALKKSDLPRETQARIKKDMDELVKDLKKAVPEVGAVFSFDFLSARGYEGYAYNHGKFPALDGSKPLTLLEHLGGNPILAVVGRGKGAEERYDLLAKWVRVLYGYGDEIARMKLQGKDKEEYEQITKAVLPLVKRFDDTTRKAWLPALADGQSGLVIDAKWSSKHWFQQAPETPVALPLPEVGILLGVSDADLLVKAVSQYRDIVNAALALAQEKTPGGAIPEIKIPPATKEEVPAGALYYYPIPKTAGLEPKILPTAGLTKDVAVFALSKEHAGRLLARKPLMLEGGPLGDPKKPLASAFYYDNVAFVDLLTPWIEFGIKSTVLQQPGMAKPEDAEAYLKQARVVLEVLKCYKGSTSATYLEGGVVVTHSETVIKDLDK